MRPRIETGQVWEGVDSRRRTIIEANHVSFTFRNHNRGTEKTWQYARVGEVAWQQMFHVLVNDPNNKERVNE